MGQRKVCIFSSRFLYFGQIKAQKEHFQASPYHHTPTSNGSSHSLSTYCAPGSMLHRSHLIYTRGNTGAGAHSVCSCSTLTEGTKCLIKGWSGGQNNDPNRQPSGGSWSGSAVNSRKKNSCGEGCKEINNSNMQSFGGDHWREGQWGNDLGLQNSLDQGQRASQGQSSGWLDHSGSREATALSYLPSSSLYRSLLELTMVTQMTNLSTTASTIIVRNKKSSTAFLCFGFVLRAVRNAVTSGVRESNTGPLKGCTSYSV